MACLSLLPPIQHARRAVACALVGLLVMLAPARALAETPANSELEDDGAASQEHVVVTAPAIEETIRSFVGEISSAGQQDQLARWDRTVCAGVAGMRRQDAQALIDRLAVIASSLGLRAGESGCRPNVLILVTEDSDTLARQIVQEHSSPVAQRAEDGHTRGRDALRHFLESPRVVRWWHVTRSYTADGFAALGCEVATEACERTRVRSMGRLHRGAREDFERVFVIVDARRAVGAPVVAVSDYIAMVVLAQIDPEAETGDYDTILNLFTVQADRPSGITEWDMAYLRGLYGAQRDARNARRQQRDIQRSMREDVETRDTRPAEQRPPL